MISRPRCSSVFKREQRKEKRCGYIFANGRCSDSQSQTFDVKDKSQPICHKPMSKCTPHYKLFSSSIISRKFSAYFTTSCFDGLGSGRLAIPP